MKEKSFLNSLLIIGVGTFINLVVGFFTTPIITRIVDPFEYGQFSIFTMYTSLALVFLCFGMDQALVRFYYNQENIEYKKRLIVECTLVPLILSLIFISIVCLLVGIGALKFKFDYPCTVLLGVNIFFNLVFRFGSLITRLNQNNKLYSFLQVLQKVLFILTAIYFLKIVKINELYSLSFATVIPILLCSIISLITQKKYLSYKVVMDKTEMRTMLKFGFPFIFSMGVTALFQSLDRLSLNYYRTYEEVGIYTSAMTIISFFAVLQNSFNVVWAPKSIEHYTNNPDDKGFYLKAFDVVTPFMFSLGITLILFKDIIALFLGPKFREASYIMPFLIFEPIMYTVSEITVSGVNFSKKSKYHICIAFGVCLLNFIGNTLLVPYLGGRGAAISTGIAYIFFFALRTFFGEKAHHMGYRIGRFSIITLLAVLYSAYNTFVGFDYISIISAAACYLIIVLLYKDSIKWGIKLIKKNFFKIFRRRQF